MHHNYLYVNNHTVGAPFYPPSLTYPASYRLLNPSLPNSKAYTQLTYIEVLILNTFVVLAKALVQPRSEMRVPTIVCKLTVTCK